MSPVNIRRKAIWLASLITAAIVLAFLVIVLLGVYAPKALFALLSAAYVAMVVLLVWDLVYRVIKRSLTNR